MSLPFDQMFLCSLCMPIEVLPMGWRFVPYEHSQTTDHLRVRDIKSDHACICSIQAHIYNYRYLHELNITETHFKGKYIIELKQFI